MVAARPSSDSTPRARKTARERIAALLDAGSPMLELGLWAAYQMYEEWGGAPGAGVVTVIGSVIAAGG